MRNRPPHIDPNSLIPSPTAAFELEPPDCDPNFSASVSDPDVDDLFYRVFIDRPLQTSSDALLPDEVQVNLNPTTNSQVIPFSLSASDFIGTNPHRVELLVADRHFTRDLQEPIGRVLVDDEGETASFMWTLSFLDACQDLTQ